jgi:hypothetical protein
MEFPPNSKKAQSEVPKEPKKVERVTSADVVRRKKSLGSRFKATFIGGDARTATEYVVTQVVIPALRDLLVDAGQRGIEKLVHGESRSGRRSPRGPSAGPSGYVTYNRMGPVTDRPDEPRTISRRARARHDFDDIILPSRTEAEEVIDRMFDLVSRYSSATVADLYDLTGLEASHVDNKWGWTDLRGSGVSRTRSGGFLLDLPDPEPID